ncbi:MAG: hypothetical protein KAQ99_02520 [Candidatus Aureabacteria bacterium]|nr:hypothetical protein [Candidatus Auribacterota bacterium]MCK5160428.1 hypothetical protein [Candidatus Auribacterota bacterium]
MKTKFFSMIKGKKNYLRKVFSAILIFLSSILALAGILQYTNIIYTNPQNMLSLAFICCFLFLIAFFIHKKDLFLLPVLLALYLGIFPFIETVSLRWELYPFIFIFSGFAVYIMGRITDPKSARKFKSLKLITYLFYLTACCYGYFNYREGALTFLIVSFLLFAEAFTPLDRKHLTGFTIKKQWLFAVGLFLLLFSICYYCCYWKGAACAAFLLIPFFILYFPAVLYIRRHFLLD